jgi:hypothetical protein
VRGVQEPMLDRLDFISGVPVIAVPAGRDAQGLPLGLQLVGRLFDEETLFMLGEVIEQAAGRFTPAKWRAWRFRAGCNVRHCFHEPISSRSPHERR